MQASPLALRIVRLTALAGAVAALTGCAVYPYPGPEPVYGPGPGVVYAPAPVVVGPPVYVGPRIYGRGYYGHGHGHGHRGWRHR